MKHVFRWFWLLVALVSLNACANAKVSEVAWNDPTITLNVVQVQNYYAPPWAGWPGPVPTPTQVPGIITPTQYVPFPGTISVPLALAFVWDIHNPNNAPVTLEQLKFTVEFESLPSRAGEYFALAMPTFYEKQTIPGKTTNQFRAVVMLDAAVVPSNLAVTNGQRLTVLELSSATLVRDWWRDIPDSKFGIKASAGTADMLLGNTKKVITFEGRFPK